MDICSLNTNTTEIHDKFMSGSYNDEEKSLCVKFMNTNLNDPELTERFTHRVNTDNFTCGVMSMNRRHASQDGTSVATGARYQIMNDVTVIFYSKDAKELFVDMEEVKAKMTKKNIKGIVQTANGALVTYGY